MKLKFVLRIVYILLISIVSCNVAEAQTLHVFPAAIEFDFESGNDDDALTISDNSGNPSTIPEYQIGFTDDPVAYIMGQESIKIKVAFEDDSYSDSVHLIVNLTVFDGNGIGAVSSIFIPNYDLNNAWDFRTLDLTGKLPLGVGKHSFTWRWKIYAIPINGNACFGVKITDTEHDYYTVYSEPKTPMEEPCPIVLDYACDWANGQTTAINIAQKVTEGIYNNIGDTDGDIDYDWPYGRSFFSEGTDKRTFNLENFFWWLEHDNDVLVNCSDVANLFNVCSAALGLNSYSKRIENYSTPFYTNPINSIGSPLNGSSDWDIIEWGYHHFGLYNNKVNDPCLKVNSSNPILPSNMEQTLYNNYLINPNYSYNDSSIAVGVVKYY